MKTLLCLLSFIAAVMPALQAQESEQVTAPREKIKTIVLPDFVLEDVPLRNALDQLKQAGTKADPEPDNQYKGVNLVLKFAPDDPVIARRITLNMKSPTMEAVFREIATQADVLIVAEPYAIAIIPKTEQVPSERIIAPLN